MRKHKNHLTKAMPKEIIGTGLTGHLRIGYDELVSQLGEPNDRTKPGRWESSDRKTRAEWAVKFGPTVITIYDYKAKEPVEAVTLWHVGSKGNTKAVGNFLRMYLRAEFEGIESTRRA